MTFTNIIYTIRLVAMAETEYGYRTIDTLESYRARYKYIAEREFHTYVEHLKNRCYGFEGVTNFDIRLSLYNGNEWETVHHISNGAHVSE